MYDEDAYKQARESAISLKCPFERALLSGCVNCSKAKRLLLAERDAVSCTDKTLNSTCGAFYAALHQNARFALRMDSAQPWPFGKEIRAQCGGVLGLKAVLGHVETEEADVAGLVAEGLMQHSDIEHFPYSEIMRGVVHYVPRKRRI